MKQDNSGCLCCDSTRKISEIIQRHGSVEEFSEAIWRACDDLFITVEEAQKAIKEYRETLDKAEK